MNEDRWFAIVDLLAIFGCLTALISTFLFVAFQLSFYIWIISIGLGMMVLSIIIALVVVFGNPIKGLKHLFRVAFGKEE